VTDCTDQRYVANHLQMTMPMTHGRTLAILSSVAYNQMPQSLTTLNNLMQQVDYHSLNTYHYVSMMTRLFGLYFKNQLALETRSQKADFQGGENDASSASRLTKRVPSWTATLHIRKDNVYWEGSALLKYWDISTVMHPFFPFPDFSYSNVESVDGMLSQNLFEGFQGIYVTLACCESRAVILCSQVVNGIFPNGNERMRLFCGCHFYIAAFYRLIY
jgi:hypothetical protein